MPEIIEVKNYADFIKKRIKNKKLLKIKILNGRYKNTNHLNHIIKLKKIFL